MMSLTLPMPVREFLQEFLPTSQIPDDDPSTFAAGAFSFVIVLETRSVLDLQLEVSQYFQYCKPHCVS
ncbi:hypothetical protein CY34DRAFT_806874 [Suillus luteus UH-Slu-Lm8-n1]|uniref:Uncharacterized protein n=1 Tax=Suillus luteus UH-Slu-Lm8-n1 TaxID=930992 RepID=A0A0D0BB00_9AGAM|nr:hypothetical protein CY34DRAFT_806874 [Suillus luteus UH-Slu-Lm8-n1]